MATFKTCVQKQRKDGFYQVYIRVTHLKKSMYIKTDKFVNSKGLDATGNIKDTFVLKYCINKISDFVERLNKMDITNWTVHDIVSYLDRADEDICFSEYARKYKFEMARRGQNRNARNYELAYQHLERYAGTNKLMFSRFTTNFIDGWIKSLSETARAKEMYPICIRQIFKQAVLDYNDYDRGIIIIKTNPWLKVKIPAADKPEKRAITPEECRVFFSSPLPESKMKDSLPELGRDVAMMVLCLAGINTVDLYKMRKENYEDGVLKYQRAKTRKSRTDGAYMEMRVPAILKPVINKYLAEEGDEHLFSFYKRHTTSDSFSANVNIGIKKICENMNISKPNQYCVYTFRHTWGTIAQNDCGASISDVAFAMNHSNGHNITRGYIKIDFSPAWELNEKVIDLIFFSTQKSHREQQAEDSGLRISPKYLVRGSLFFRGKMLHEIEDIGFNNKEEVISRLYEYVPEDIPERSMLQFKIENRDRSQVAVYERMKIKAK